MKTIALYNIKGGVGKTATAVNLAYLAARDGLPTLLIDLDPQGAASFYFRIRPPKKLSDQSLVDGKKKIGKRIRATDFEHLDLLPADFSYRNLDLTLDSARRSKKQLSDLLKAFEDEYAYVFIDCPPNITLVSENVFLAADILLVPVIPTTLSVRTFASIIDFFEEENLKNKCIPFFSMVESRKNLHKESMLEVRNNYPAVMQQPIPYLSDIEKMGINRQPVPVFRPSARAAQAYEKLWQELKHITEV